MIDDLLTYSQLGRTQPAAEPADLNEIVGDVIETLGPAIDDRNAIVRIDGVLPVLKADRVLAGEVFRNLIANALKFNDSERPTIEVGCGPQGAVFVATMASAFRRATTKASLPCSAVCTAGGSMREPGQD